MKAFGWASILIVLIIGLIICGCAGPASVPTATDSVELPTMTNYPFPTATATQPPSTETDTPEPTATFTFTPMPPTATNTPTPEVLPVAGIWIAKGVNVTFSMPFEIFYQAGTAFFRPDATSKVQCPPDMRVWLKGFPRSESLPIVAGQFQAGQGQQDLRGQVLSPSQIEGTWNITACNLTVKWIGTLSRAAPETPQISGTP